MDFKSIKCPMCNGKTKLSKASVKLFNGMIVLKDNPIFECLACKETFATGKIVDSTLEKAKNQFNFSRQIISTGGSLGVTFPSDLSTYYKLKKNSKIDLIPQGPKEIKIIIQ